MRIKNIGILAISLIIICTLAACKNTSDSTDTQSTTEAGDDLKVWKLSIAQAPERVEYEEGEEFDPAGVVINATLMDGSVVENVPYELSVNSPLTRTTLAAKFIYGGKTVEQMIDVSLKGNRLEYSVYLVPEQPDSPLKGKTIFWLGSSVTEGASSGKESMVDFIARKHGAVCIKEAVSGTTLADVMDRSYVNRLNKYLASDERVEHLDAFVCQLSTNDKGMTDGFGIVTPNDVCDPSAFDTATTFGAVEYIIATVTDNWGCPIFFYSNPPMGDENYGVMVDALEKIADKWDVTIIDMYRDQEFNNITEEEQLLYMADKIHPTKAGYRIWWLPKFEEALSGI